MNTFKMLLHHLNEKPAIGMASGFGSSFLLGVQKFLTDDTLLKMISGIGICLGVMIALITFMLKCIEFSEKIRAKKNGKY